MSQMKFEFEGEEEGKIMIPMDAALHKRLVALMARILIKIIRNRGEENDDKQSIKS